MLTLLGLRVIIFFAVLMLTSAKAFPEKTVFLTKNPFERSGTAMAPETNPAPNRAERPGATDLELGLLENTITSAPICSITAAITDTYTDGLTTCKLASAT